MPDSDRLTDLEFANVLKKYSAGIISQRTYELLMEAAKRLEQRQPEEKDDNK